MPAKRSTEPEPEPELMIQISVTTAHGICGDALEQLTEDLNREDWVEAMQHAGLIAEIAEAVESARAA